MEQYGEKRNFPHGMKRPDAPATERFLSRVTTDGGGRENVGVCWDWGGYRDGSGYGQFWFHGAAVWSHRFAYAAFVGDVPTGYHVHHTCGNTSCVRPTHLQIVTASENSTRMSGPVEVTDRIVPF